ncbi:unnamed protein product [Rotaria magnacalcarata]|uniref:Uncharacterized protein n=1 Tax=Rotaria magnacalcarata TaxID=392030 RepID=A0A820S6M8_9BILA|nr:unnamed protein product [Rotaria magnacalcarata]
MKERILVETTSITKIYDEEIVKANISKGATALIPTVVEFRSNMSKARRKKTPVIPSTFMFEIPDLYQSTLTEKRFLLIDIFLKRGQDRILIFASDQQLKLLYESSTIFMDGTFDIAPAPFKQVYLIHAEKFGQGLPVAFCILPNRRGLASDYLHNEAIRNQCRQIMTLSLMPIEQVHSQFQRLETITSAALSDLLLYFKNQWVHGVVPISMWNFFDVIHRTNNISEAYNLRFSSRLSKKHPNIWCFIQLIQSEHVRFEHILIQLEAGASPPKQSKKNHFLSKKI